jgi:hypothetical protein
MWQVHDTWLSGQDLGQRKERATVGWMVKSKWDLRLGGHCCTNANFLAWRVVCWLYRSVPVLGMLCTLECFIIMKHYILKLALKVGTGVNRVKYQQMENERQACGHSLYIPGGNLTRVSRTCNLAWFVTRSVSAKARARAWMICLSNISTSSNRRL